jgi:hypothetical protein
MTTTARDYLVNRFQTDAVVLRERVALMARGTKVPGPDAATSSRMADACEEVVAMLLAIASHGDADAELDAIMALVPLLEHRATAQQATPPVRSVYAGAATRIREVRSAEAQSSPADRIPAEHLDDAERPDVDMHDDLDDLDDMDDDDIDDDVIVFDEDDDRTDATP